LVRSTPKWRKKLEYGWRVIIQNGASSNLEWRKGKTKTTNSEGEGIGFSFFGQDTIKCMIEFRIDDHTIRKEL
jgi:hypothetical protein